MKPVDQCPSSHKEGKADKAELATFARELPKVAGGASGLRAWRGVEEIADTGEFRDWLEREFPQGASELETASEGGQETRRTFLKLMGASLALAGAATLPGCRRPDHKILPYSARNPEEIVPGKPLFYASAMPLPGGGAEGVLVETHEGRPTKIEGNPLHPMNRGKSSVWAQASVLGLYDPDRLKMPILNRSAMPKDAIGTAPADTHGGHGGGRGGEEHSDLRAATWDDFRAWAKTHLAAYDARKGAGVAIIVDKKTSVTRDAMRDRLKGRFPQAMFVAYSPIDPAASLAAGTRLAFGANLREQLTFTSGGKLAAKVIVSLDRDFLDQSDPANLSNNREFSATRRVLGVKDEMSRLYAIESNYSVTGGMADHRLRLAPSRVGGFAVLLAKAVMGKISGSADTSALKAAIDGIAVPAGDDIPAAFVDAVAEDLVTEATKDGAKRTRVGETLVVVGASQPAAVQAIGHALNAALGNLGKTVSYIPMSDELASDGSAGLKAVADGIASGAITTVVCIGTNPVYDAPAELDFAKLLARTTSITLSVDSTETAAASMWSLNGAHWLESWGDAESWDGTIAPIQPMIAPLFEPALSEIEMLALLADPNAGVSAKPAVAEAKPGEAKPAAAPADAKSAVPVATVNPENGHDLVRAAWKARLKQDDATFEKTWRRALHDGVLAGVKLDRVAPAVRLGEVASAVAAMPKMTLPGTAELETAFVQHHVGDGRFANLGWLQELPHVGTRVVWDNPALLSPKTAKALGVTPEWYSDSNTGKMYTKEWPEGRIARITVGGRSIEVACWILPGMADNTVLLPLGYGRGKAGRVADGVGFNLYPLRTSASPWAARGARLEKLNATYMIASTQNHWSVESRTSLVRQVDLPAWRKFGDDAPVAEKDRIYATAKVLPFAERVGHSELTHTPPNINAYQHPYKKSDNPYTKTQEPALTKPKGTYDGLMEEPEATSRFAQRPQWGMSIDLSTCTGCGACTIACQSENNIPIVGKKETAKGREMTWIRVDRYFISDWKEQSLDEINEPVGVLHQPIACVHCENAPCEVVCPVNATVHGPEGHNYMVYNRCIGTRYCANNCPYKVRRFNFFDYGVKKFNGDYVGKDLIEAAAPDRGGVTGSGEHNKINVNFIPPRFRQKLDEIEKMQKNPDVTIRSRGVMEKCTYCIQRTNEAKIEMKLHDLKGIPDGFVQAACQQACPAGAIEFGDILDDTSEGANGFKGSRVRAMRQNQRSYMLLNYLNTTPRTTHMVRVMNPNPKLRKPMEDPFGSHGGEHGADHHGGKPAGDHGGEKHSQLPPVEGGVRGVASPLDPSRSAFLRDAGKKLADQGYALSLRVLGV